MEHPTRDVPPDQGDTPAHHLPESGRAAGPAAPRDRIAIHGARQNNLKNLSLEIPTNELVVVTGVSGSGKSSLVFDTLYAEGQRRYVETFSPYARQFLDRMDKPQVDRIDGMPAGDRHRSDEPGAHVALDRGHDDRAERPHQAALRARGAALLPGLRQPGAARHPGDDLRRAHAPGPRRRGSAARNRVPGRGAEELQRERDPAAPRAAGLHPRPRQARQRDRGRPGPRPDGERRARAGDGGPGSGAQGRAWAGERACRGRERRSPPPRVALLLATCTAPTATSTTPSRRRACSRSTRRSAPARPAAGSDG